jgi:hypothetical protein
MNRFQTHSLRNGALPSKAQGSITREWKISSKRLLSPPNPVCRNRIAVGSPAVHEVTETTHCHRMAVYHEHTGSSLEAIRQN